MTITIGVPTWSSFGGFIHRDVHFNVPVMMMVMMMMVMMMMMMMMMMMIFSALRAAVSIDPSGVSGERRSARHRYIKAP